MVSLLPLTGDVAWGSILRYGPGVAVSGDEIAIGDTLFHLRGVDAFELDQECFDEGESVQCGTEARRVLNSLLTGQDVVCGGPGDGFDGRREAFCGTPIIKDLGLEIVRRGWALARPDLDTRDAYALCFAEAEAARARRGAWKYQFTLPFAHRRESVSPETASCGNAAMTRR